MARALLGLLEAGPERDDATDAYIAWALPLHAALAGELTALLGDARFLARVHWYAMWQALALAYPDGVPPDGIAADIHYLHAQGVEPGSQGEWVAWLHHAAVSRGDTTLADALVEFAVPLPWRTVWSRWRLPGRSGASAQDPGRVEKLRAASYDDAWALSDWRELEMRGPNNLTVYERRMWDAWTGELLTGPTRIEQNWPDRPRGEPFPGVEYAKKPGDAWRFDHEQSAGVPRMPNAVSEAVRLGDAGKEGALWAFAGTGGLFAAVVDEAAVAAHPAEPWPTLFIPGPISHSAPWALPWPIPSAQNLSRTWLENKDRFRADACRPIPVAQLPVELRHEETRRFLTETGWPVARGISGLYSPDLSVSGLTPVEGSTLLSGLGQVGSRQLWLDGSQGHVLMTCHSASGPERHLAGSSISQFLILLALHHTALCTPLTAGDAEMYDLGESLPEWFRAVDPAAAESPVWEGESDNFEALLDDYELVLSELDEVRDGNDGPSCPNAK
ncbi:SUKH-4 family immunity protein [Streptomyces sp. NPDC050738]|uniref:SUKH-4 family immunity protein n=1 Tax=Streptomyces sp. NPDC050738 TaxID=3154744 RepID=UPI0034240A0C